MIVLGIPLAATLVAALLSLLLVGRLPAAKAARVGGWAVGVQAGVAALAWLAMQSSGCGDDDVGFVVLGFVAAAFGGVALASGAVAIRGRVAPGRNGMLALAAVALPYITFVTWVGAMLACS